MRVESDNHGATVKITMECTRFQSGTTSERVRDALDPKYNKNLLLFSLTIR